MKVWLTGARQFAKAVALVSASILLCGCSQQNATSSKSDQPFAGRTLYVFNWSDYIDPELVTEFEERTGAHVQYDNYASDAELETKLFTGGGNYDVVFPSDRSVAALIKKDLLAEIDTARIANWKNLDAKFLNPPHDPGNRHSVPYFWGTVAVGFRSDHVPGPVKGFEVLFDERYEGRISMLDDPENVVAICMLHLGHPMNSIDDAHLAEVEELLKKQAPLVQAYTADTFKEKLIKDEAWVALGWSGDMLQAREIEPKIQVIVPETGTMIWIDSMVMPKDAANADLAYEFINFLLEPEIAARNANFVKYASPNVAAREKIDAKLLNDPAVYPPPNVLDRCEWLQDRGAAIAKLEQLWQRVRR